MTLLAGLFARRNPSHDAQQRAPPHGSGSYLAWM
jgi:hypothetical protein